MKLMTSANEVVAVTHESKADITYCSMVLATNHGMACLTIYF
jgi:hypothetical protein